MSDKTEPSEGTDWQETARVLARAINTGDMSEVQDRLAADQPTTEASGSVAVRPTVYPRDLHLAENLSPEQEALRGALVKLDHATGSDGYEYTETVSAMEYVSEEFTEVARAFAALLNAETTPAPQPAADTEVQWGIRTHDGGPEVSVMVDPPSPEQAERIRADGYEVVRSTLTTTRTPWEEA